MSPLLAKVAPWALVVVLIGALFGGFVSHERQVGRLEVQLHSADSLAKVAQAELADAKRKSTQDSSRAAALEADTARANQQVRAAKASYVALLAPLAASKHALDSLLALSHDSASTGLVGATRAFEQRSDSTIKACSEALSSEQDALKACQAQGAAVKLQLLDTQGIVAALAKDTTAKALQIRAIRASEPGFFGVWLPRLAAFGIGVLAGRVH